MINIARASDNQNIISVQRRKTSVDAHCGDVIHSQNATVEWVRI